MIKIVQIVLTVFAVCMFVIPASANDTDVQVTVNAPEYVSNAFDAAIDIVNVTNLDSGQFDLSYDANVVNVTGVDSGSIDEIEISVEDWSFMDNNTIRVVFNLPNTTGVNGSGTLATIHFTVTGQVEDTSTLDITDGLLVDVESNITSVTWINTEVTAGMPVTVNGPEAVIDTFDATIDITDVVDLDSGQFDLSFDANIVNVTGVDSGIIGGTEIPVDVWSFMDNDTIRVLINLPDTEGISGSGTLATVHFTVMGEIGDIIALNISDGLLVNTDPNKILGTWSDIEIPVGIPVTINTPEVTSGPFNITIDVENVVDMNGGQIDLSFDSGVVNVTNVTEGIINETAIPIDGWSFIDNNTIRVIFKLSGVDGVSGSGNIAKIDFEVTGSVGDTSLLEIPNVKLADTGAQVIPAVGIDKSVAIGIPGTVNAPETVSDTFEVTIDVEDTVDMNGGQFDLSFDSNVVNVTNVTEGSIDETAIPIVGWCSMDNGTIRVIFKLSGADGVNGSGNVAKINFEVTGSAGDTSPLEISNGKLADINADLIPVIWINDEVTI